MDIPFHASETSSLGIEVELGIVDRTSRELTVAASELLAELGKGHPGGEHPKAKHELFECTIEVITGICSTVAEARADIEATLAEVTALTDARGLALMCSGTHPSSHWSGQTVSPDERYHRLVERIQWPARRLAIHGIHFHVGVRSAAKAVAITNSLAFHLPMFVALSASSPYWHGMDTGLASARTKVFEGLPTAGLPPRLPSWQAFELFMETLIRAKAIESIREVWWDVRPHPDFGTVELRMCDGMSNLTEIAAVAALAQSLVHDLDRRLDAGEAIPQSTDWVVRENKWLASRYGIDADIIVDNTGTLRPVRAVIQDQVARLEPVAVELGCADELEQVLDIVERGPGYVRQRAVLESGGTTVDVVDLLVAELTAGAPLP